MNREQALRLAVLRVGKKMASSPRTKEELKKALRKMKERYKPFLTKDVEMPDVGKDAKVAASRLEPSEIVDRYYQRLDDLHEKHIDDFQKIESKLFDDLDAAADKRDDAGNTPKAQEAYQRRKETLIESARSKARRLKRRNEEKRKALYQTYVRKYPEFRGEIRKRKARRFGAAAFFLGLIVGFLRILVAL